MLSIELADAGIVSLLFLASVGALCSLLALCCVCYCVLARIWAARQHTAYVRPSCGDTERGVEVYGDALLPSAPVNY